MKHLAFRFKDPPSIWFEHQLVGFKNDPQFQVEWALRFYIKDPFSQLDGSDIDG